MPTRPATRCPRCKTLHPGIGSCSDCRAASDLARGTAGQRGYTSPGHRSFRANVLDHDPVCVLCHLAPATVADHWPLSRRELTARGLDPNDPSRGRGLCASCHGKATAADPKQKGGWNAR